MCTIIDTFDSNWCLLMHQLFCWHIWDSFVDDADDVCWHVDDVFVDMSMTCWLIPRYVSVCCSVLILCAVSAWGEAAGERHGGAVLQRAGDALRRGHQRSAAAGLAHPGAAGNTTGYSLFIINTDIGHCFKVVISYHIFLQPSNLDVWWIDQQHLLRSTGWAGRLIYAAYI